MPSLILNRVAFITVLASAFVGSQLTSASADKLPPKPNAAEASYIATVTKALQAKYPTAHTAVAGGYYQMTRLGRDGTSIWFNDKWDNDVSKFEPNFLWYDKNGKLVGLDYQYLTSSHPKPPGKDIYPVMGSRWTTIPAHMHFAYKLPDGTIKRRGAELVPKLHSEMPTAAELRAAKLLPAKATLLWAHVHPKSWDLGFWLVPNPNGVFADLNPLVKP
jgi:hypothetical protein